ncbi:hypothetical protein FNV43_RR12651 [Rhamnella rubrinervis]|uniref:Phytosulfokine-beta n=1 Tax=Rhamnella rubrinervis TaxID=2594499 RepID=A0A8K0H8Q1_9ROSA|nr:hypothetical protein FNV43_RR12651 [Rhamnella rubrinervis]
MAKLIITLFTIVLLLSFALSYAAGATPAGPTNSLKITPGGPAFKPTTDITAIKAKQQTAGASKVLDMEDENCERIYGMDDCMARRTRAANFENAQNSQ